MKKNYLYKSHCQPPRFLKNVCTSSGDKILSQWFVSIAIPENPVKVLWSSKSRHCRSFSPDVECSLGFLLLTTSTKHSKKRLVNIQIDSYWEWKKCWNWLWGWVWRNTRDRALPTSPLFIFYAALVCLIRWRQLRRIFEIIPETNPVGKSS